MTHRRKRRDEVWSVRKTQTAEGRKSRKLSLPWLAWHTLCLALHTSHVVPPELSPNYIISQWSFDDLKLRPYTVKLLYCHITYSTTALRLHLDGRSEDDRACLTCRTRVHSTDLGICSKLTRSQHLFKERSESIVPKKDTWIRLPRLRSVKVEQD